MRDDILFLERAISSNYSYSGVLAEVPPRETPYLNFITVFRSIIYDVSPVGAATRSIC